MHLKNIKNWHNADFPLISVYWQVLVLLMLSTNDKLYSVHSLSFSFSFSISPFYMRMIILM